MITTANGQLVITISEQNNHNLNFMSGMCTRHDCLRHVTCFVGMLQSWNKLCFTTGYIEVNLSLPGSGEVPGLWPGAIISPYFKPSLSQAMIF